jgi:hypothetical protein
MRTTLTRLSVAGVTALAVLLPATTASAADSVVRSGSCSGSSTWALRATEAEGDVAALRLFVNSTRAGQTWNVVLTRQGNQFFFTRRTTNGAGDFLVTRNAREANDVNDLYTARARNLTTNEVCSARVVLPD